ncbi:hydroxyethylthiazole kinase [Paenibacillus ehimensis]|uniref:Hydroxyethylthiazole kinase n=1 Tax=Paenibacillus ehimensis TaxID=79264 RepID=A0ABT8V7Y7_9BACL|nr:hydroxyethylthiazole kinase [Paenibacillus ehimensis]MDO3677563.1 hydroxyethylthiazole kinase [Paenibacillus ehimensis]MEC0208840.1 hydroxyethylthiazole kinase [Paenibacillus ehimensis]
MNNNPTSSIGDLLSSVRRTKPLVHHLTNYVTVNDCANVTLAIGASPIMADDIEEAADMTAISSALVLNIGTLNTRTVESMLAAGKKANEMGTPVVLDPVGAGASKLRNQTVRMMLEQLKFSVIRGNMSEIRFIAGLQATTKGVDASEADLENGLQSGIDIANKLAEQYHCTVAITGATDIVSDGKSVICMENGHPMLGSITGTGCMSTSLIGSFCGVTADYRMAAVAGLLCMGIAGELAYETAGQQGNGSYRVALIDEISKINSQTMHERAKVYEA